MISGIELRKNRIARKLTLSRVAEQIGVSVSHLAYVEQGERLPSLELYLKLLELYDLNSTKLQRGKDLKTEIVEKIHLNPKIAELNRLAFCLNESELDELLSQLKGVEG